jgi:hypothetical protein
MSITFPLLVSIPHSVTNLPPKWETDDKPLRACLENLAFPTRSAGKGPGVRAVSSGRWSVASGQYDIANDKPNPQSLIPNPCVAHPNPLPAGEGTSIISPHPNPLPEGEGTSIPPMIHVSLKPKSISIFQLHWPGGGLRAVVPRFGSVPVPFSGPIPRRRRSRHGSTTFA